jgi:hypothetical protein
MYAIFELYANAYLPAAGIHRRPRPEEHLGDLGSDGELTPASLAQDEPRRRSVRAFMSRLLRETTAACLWRYGPDAHL